MPGETSNPKPREQALHDAQRRLRLLEIETHRIKAELARLEALREDHVADELEQQLPRVAAGIDPRLLWKRVVTSVPPPDNALQEHVTRGQPADRAANHRPATDRAARPPAKADRTKSRPEQISTGNQPVTSPADGVARKERGATGVPAPAWSRFSRRLRTAPAWLISVLFHVVLCLFGLATFVTLQNETIPLLASSVDAAEEIVAEPVEIELEQTEVEIDEFDELATADALEFDDMSLDTFDVPAQAVGALSPDMGLDAMLSDVSTLMAGTTGGEPAAGGGKPRGTNFFGTPSQGKRIVFVVDNSGSMQEGRMETTFFELLRSVESMNPDQFFYVIFYSDQVYPLFFPETAERLVPATPDNRQRLGAWLETVELCTGGRLVDAMKLANSLKPQVVYILSDGDIRSSTTMQYLTTVNDWTFTIHTLGMTVRNASDAAKLAAIADAHRGTFRTVQPSPDAIQLARQRPIKYNRQRGPVWGSKIR